MTFGNSISLIAFKFGRNAYTAIFENTESTLPQLQAIEGHTIFSLELQLKIELFLTFYYSLLLLWFYDFTLIESEKTGCNQLIKCCFNIFYDDNDSK